jgi:hypothetical protein
MNRYPIHTQVLKNSVGQLKTRSWFDAPQEVLLGDRLTTNGFLNYQPEGELPVRPEQPARRACPPGGFEPKAPLPSGHRRVNNLATAVVRMKSILAPVSRAVALSANGNCE